MKTPGQVAYEAYCDVACWETEPALMQSRWDRAAKAVIEADRAARVCRPMTPTKHDDKDSGL